MKALLALTVLCATSLSAYGSNGYGHSNSNMNSNTPNQPSMNGQTPAEQAEQRLRDQTSKPLDPARSSETISPNGQPSMPSNGYSRSGRGQPTHVAAVEAEMSAAQANAKYPLDTAKTFKDKKLNDKIRGKIEGWFADDYKGVILKTDNGIVIISGNIESEDLSNDLAEQVRKMDGVKQVRNKVKANNTK